MASGTSVFTIFCGRSIPESVCVCDFRLRITCSLCLFLVSCTTFYVIHRGPRVCVYRSQKHHLSSADDDRSVGINCYKTQFFSFPFLQSVLSMHTFTLLCHMSLLLFTRRAESRGRGWRGHHKCTSRCTVIVVFTILCNLRVCTYQ